MSETVLKIDNISFPIGSARGITQTITPVDNGELRRTVNGELVDITRAENRKYESTINCADMGIPTLGDIWRGKVISVECISNIRQSVSPASATAALHRPHVSDSVFGYTQEGEKVTPQSVSLGVATFQKNIVRVDFRPKLSMMVMDWSSSDDEYEASSSWTLSLSEV